MTNLHTSDWEMVDEVVERAGTRVPDYADEVIAMTGRVHQRPAWTFPGRWLPARVADAGVRWVLVAALLALAALAGLLLWAGARPAPVPRVASNGLIAVEVQIKPWLVADGAAYFSTIDPGSGTVVTPPSRTWTGTLVGFSPDGSRLAYLVRDDALSSDAAPVSRVWTSAPDGTGAVPATGPLRDITSAGWAPDGRRLVVSFREGESQYRIGIVGVDGSGSRTLAVGMQADEATWQPNGDRILFRGWRERPPGLYTVAPDNPSDVRRVGAVDAVASTQGIDPGAAWSPDGTSVAFVLRAAGGQNRIALHLVRADGSGERVLEIPGFEDRNPSPCWALDGRSVVVKAFMQLVQVPVDGSAPREIGPRSVDDNFGMTDFACSPDGAVVASAPQPTVTAELDGSRSFTDAKLVLTDVAHNTWATLDPGAEMVVGGLPGRTILAWQPVAR